VGNSAQNAANNAQASANSASTAAGAAQGTANTALGAAGAAQSSANAAQVTADDAQRLGRNSAQYAAGGTQLDLNANGGAGTTISNVRAGAITTDAANVGQVQQAQQTAIVTANGFTNQQVAALQEVMNRAFENGLCSFSSGSVTCGAGSKATGTGATVIGRNAVANGDNTTAIGNGAEANFAGSVAIGAGARALADPTTAVGNNALAAGNNSVALGANTQAIGSNSVALGQASVALRDNTVSVGDASVGLTRQITNVAPGTLASDAANVGQVQQAVSAATHDAKTYAAKGVAAALAMPQMPALAPGKHWTGAAVGAYSGQGAVGAAWGYQVNEALNVGVGVSGAMSSGTSRIATRVQLGYAW